MEKQQFERLVSDQEKRRLGTPGGPDTARDSYRRYLAEQKQAVVSARHDTLSRWLKEREKSKRQESSGAASHAFRERAG